MDIHKLLFIEDLKGINGKTAQDIALEVVQRFFDSRFRQNKIESDDPMPEHLQSDEFQGKIDVNLVSVKNFDPNETMSDLVRRATPIEVVLNEDYSIEFTNIRGTHYYDPHNSPFPSIKKGHRCWIVGDVVYYPSPDVEVEK